MKKLFLLLGLFLGIYVIAVGQPVAGFTFVFTNSGCSPDSVVFTNTSTGSNTYKWDFGDFSPTVSDTNTNHVYSFSSTFIVELTAYDLGGDSSKFRKVIFIKSSSIFLFFFASADTVCLGDLVEFINFTSPMATCLWKFGDGDTSNAKNAKHTYASAGTYPVTLIMDNGCAIDSLMDTVVVDSFVKPFSSFFASSTTVCPTEPITFENFSSHLPGSMWDFGDGNTSTDIHPCHMYANHGTYICSLIVSNFCSTDTSFQVITVDSSLTPSPFLFADADTICPGMVVSFFLTSGVLVSQIWDFDDGVQSIDPNTTHSFATGNFNVTLTATNYCGNSTVDSISIVSDSASKPQASFSMTPFGVACPGEVIEFHNFSSQSVSSLWFFGDGDTSTATDPKHSYSTKGIYAVTLYVVTDCGIIDSTTLIMTIDSTSSPFAFFSIPPGSSFPEIACPNTPTTLFNFSFGATSFFWDFGDGTTSTQFEPTHQYSALGDYAILLEASNACGKKSYDAQPICITPSGVPDASSFFVNPLNTCLGNPVFSSLSISSGVGFLLDWGDGNTDTVPNTDHTYATSGQYNVKLVITNDCGSDSITHIVNIKSGPIANFVCDSVCEGDSTSFTDLSTGNIISWLWDLGDGTISTDQNPKHLYSNDGNYNVLLTVLNDQGCADIFSKIVPVFSEIFANAGPDDTICLGDTAQLIGAGGSFFEWSPAGSLINNLSFNPEAFPTSTTTYTLVILGSNFTCSDTDMVTIVVLPLPIITADSSQTICEGDSIKIIATGGLSYLWEPDSSFTSDTVCCPFAFPTTTTTYTVQGTDANGCSDSATVTITVDPLPIASFTRVINQNQVQFTNTSQFETKVHWDFGDGDTSIVNNTTHSFSPPGTYIVCLTVTNNCGTDSICDTIIIASGLAEISNSINLEVSPNPYKNITNIEYTLFSSAQVNLEVYNLLGKRIAVIQNSRLGAGTYNVNFSAAELGYGGGIYILKLNVDGLLATKRLVEL